MSNKLKKLDWPKIIMAGIPISAILWFLIFVALLFSMKNTTIAIQISILGMILGVIIYLIACIKYSSTLKVELTDDLLEDIPTAGKSFLEQTGQKFKMNTLFVIVILCFVACMFDDKLSNILGWTPENVFHISIFVGFLSFAIIGYSLKCSSCKKSLLWYAIRRKDKNAWSQWLLTFPECPCCGFKPIQN